MLAPTDIVRFTVTADHLKLIERMYVEWFDCETGAPCIDPKRPYGNSDVGCDVCEILGWEKDEEADCNPLTDRQLRAAAKVHKETKTALQICLSRLEFEPGVYESTDICNRTWKLVA